MSSRNLNEDQGEITLKEEGWGRVKRAVDYFRTQETSQDFRK